MGKKTDIYERRLKDANSALELAEQKLEAIEAELPKALSEKQIVLINQKKEIIKARQELYIMINDLNSVFLSMQNLKKDPQGEAKRQQTPLQQLQRDNFRNFKSSQGKVATLTAALIISAEGVHSIFQPLLSKFEAHVTQLKDLRERLQSALNKINILQGTISGDAQTNILALSKLEQELKTELKNCENNLNQAELRLQYFDIRIPENSIRSNSVELKKLELFFPYVMAMSPGEQLLQGFLNDNPSILKVLEIPQKMDITNMNEDQTIRSGLTTLQKNKHLHEATDKTLASQEKHLAKILDESNKQISEIDKQIQDAIPIAPAMENVSSQSEPSISTSVSVSASASPSPSPSLSAASAGVVPEKLTPSDLGEGGVTLSSTAKFHKVTDTIPTKTSASEGEPEIPKTVPDKIKHFEFFSKNPNKTVTKTPEPTQSKSQQEVDEAPVPTTPRKQSP